VYLSGTQQQWRMNLPLYDFVNKETGEQFTKMMKISEKSEYLEANPHIESIILSAPKLTSGFGGIKNDNGWKENLSRIAEAHPNSALAEKQGGRSSKAAKVGELAKKHGYGKSGRYNMDL